MGVYDAPEVVLTVASIFEVLSGGAFGCMGQRLWGAGLALAGEPHLKEKKKHISEFGTQERPQARGSFFSPCWMAGVSSSSVATAQSIIHPALHSQPSIPPPFDSFKLAFSKVYF